jgi:hypothetical protein
MATQWEDHVYLNAHPREKSLNFGEIRPGIEVTVGGSNDIDLLGRCFRCFFRFALFVGAVLLPEPHQCAIRTLPLILVNGAR